MWRNPVGDGANRVITLGVSALASTQAFSKGSPVCEDTAGGRRRVSSIAPDGVQIAASNCGIRKFSTLAERLRAGIDGWRTDKEIGRAYGRDRECESV